MNSLGQILEKPLWVQVWQQKALHITVFFCFLLLIIVIILLRDRLSKKRALLNLIKYGVLTVSFVYVGILLKAQPTTTNIIIILNSLKELKFPVGLFLLEPFIFLSFVFIFVTLFIWGRGVFCGWLCPYGAMLELLNKIYERIFPKFRIKLPERVHQRLLYLKYFIFLTIVAVSFMSFILSEYMTEVEPFRTFVLRLNRQWYFVLYFMILTVGSVLLYRAFCRYLCPLGAALSIPSFLRGIPLVKLKRYDLCGKCKICEKTCTPQAVMPEGSINTRECLYCLDCQANFWDEELCPVLLKRKKKKDSEVFSDTGGGTVAGMLAVSVGIFLLFFSHQADAKRLIVGVDTKTISEAVAMAADGDTIEVRPGIYRERLRIDRAVFLKGIDNPVITAPDGNIVEISGSGVVMEGFTLKYEDTSGLSSTDTAIFIKKGAEGVVVRNNRMERVMFGIWNIMGKDIVIENNVVVGLKELSREKRGNCINLTGTKRAHVTGNRLDYCRDGIYMEVCHDSTVTDNEIRNSRYSIHTMWVDRGEFSRNRAFGNLVGLAIMYTKRSEVKNNISCGNQTHGILLLQAVRSEITDNIVIGNTKGIFLYNSVFNTLSSNLIMNNQLGIHNWGGSEDNEIKGNTFINNEVQVKFVAGRDQYWDENYWSDYIGWDMTGDGVGDFPYESNTVVDYILWRYPMSKVLFTSPALQILWVLEKQFPVISVPKIVDRKPAMKPFHTRWKQLRQRYPYSAERYYGDIEKLPHLPGGVY